MKSRERFTNRLCLLLMFLISSMTAQPQSNLEAWVRRYNSSEAGSSDYARKIAVDPDGNVVVAGDTDDGITGIDILIIKYSGAGVALWTNRYNGPANGDDRGASVGVDQSGNVFATGSSSDMPGGTNSNYITFAFSPAGVPLWTNYYNGPANAADVPKALAVGHSGNVFVTGSSAGNYTTIAYSGAGVALWTNLYEPGGFSQGAYAVTADNSGNVFVTGSSGGDYATIGYSGAGIPLWTNHYSDGGDQAIAVAIGVDSAGNVFVTGSSYGIGSFYDDHYSTIAYSPAGVPLWTNRYNGATNGPVQDFATALAVDHNGNVIVTGYSQDLPSSGFSYATIAYSGAGVALWTNRYKGLGGFDRPYAVAVDKSGNVFVTGTSAGDYATIKYSGAGVALWTNRYDGPDANSPDGAYDVSVDSSGNIFVTGHSRADYATIAYSSEGVPVWTNRYNGPVNSDDDVSALAVDQSTGNVLVTGYSSLGANSDYVTIVYSEAGVALWTNRYNGPANREDGASSVAADSRGNVIVTGGSYGEISFNYATIAYSASGVPLWTNRYGGPGNFYDYARAIAVDGSGNVFVTGNSYGSGRDYDYATIGYSAAGVALWTNRYNGPGNNSSDYAWAVAADKTGNVFVTGYSNDNDGQDYATVAYSPAGVALWTNRYGGPVGSFDRAHAIAVDRPGRVFVTGHSSAGGSNHDYATIAYSEGGVALWTNRYNGLANGDDGARAIAVDHNGNVFVTGYSTGTGSGWDFATIAYSGAGVALWTNRYNGTGNTNDQANAVMVDDSGNVFVTGYSIGPGSSYDYAIIAYSGAGAALWTNRYNGPANGTDQPALSSCLAIGRDGGVYVTGSSDGHYGNASISDYATIKYVWRPQLAVQPLTAASSTVNLTLSGPANSPWAIQRALNITGPWTNLGSSLIGTNGSAIFPDANPPAKGALYRATQP